jgi:hypothetical protein
MRAHHSGHSGQSLRTNVNVLDAAARAEQIVLEHTLPL